MLNNQSATLCPSPIASSESQVMIQSIEPLLQNQWASIFDVLPNAITIYDTEDCLKYHNPAFLNLFGWEDDESLINKEMREIIQAMSPLLRNSDDALQAHSSENKRHFFELTNGRWIESNFQSHPFGNLISFQDISKGEHLAREASELKEANLNLTQTLNMVSHDLRTPLAAIIGYAEFLEERFAGDLSKQQENFVNQIMESADLLGRTLGILLDYARLEANTLRLNFETVDYTKVIETIAANHNTIARNRGVRLLTLIAPSLPPLELDYERITQVINNLLANAFKLTPSGGRVELRAFRKDDCIITEVKDTGVGFSKSALSTIFEKVRPGKQDVETGLGLGLAIAKRLVETHGGLIEASSTPGVGSTFRFSLPIQCKNTTIN